MSMYAIVARFTFFAPHKVSGGGMANYASTTISAVLEAPP